MKSKMFSLLSSLVLAAPVFLCGPGSNAQAQNRDREKELPKSGSLSTNYMGPGTNSGMPGPWGGTDPSGQEVAPISGSVSRLGTEQWLMRVFNNSEDAYSVSLAVVQRSPSGSSIKRDSFSYTLKPGETKERELSRHPQAENADLELLSWRNLTSKKKAAAASATPIAGQ